MLAILPRSGDKGNRRGIPESDLISKFWQKVDKSGDCWVWTGPKRNGYGQYRQQRTHRISWVVVMHKCDNPACVRPDHLALGTQADNLRDMHEKGRSPVSAKMITPVGRQAAKDAYLAGFKRVNIARYFGVHPGTITRLLDTFGIEREYKQRLNR